MRPIDADALDTRVEAEFDGVCVYDVSGIEAARDFCDIVDTAPTIDAIPVDWLDDRANDITRAPLYRRFAQMILDDWQKEQGAST